VASPIGTEEPREVLGVRTHPNEDASGPERRLLAFDSERLKVRLESERDSHLVRLIGMREYRRDGRGPAGQAAAAAPVGSWAASPCAPGRQ
jgi:hypothetical protein